MGIDTFIRALGIITILGGFWANNWKISVLGVLVAAY